MNNDLMNYINRLKSIADTGLLYTTNDYDKERYNELRDISFELLHATSGHTIENLKANFPLVKDYPTAKVDIRGLIISPENKILMVQEIADGKWSLPGGWADVGYSPKETIIKECKEETGLDVEVKNLLAVFDKRKHKHPPQAFYVYKMVFYCNPVSTEINKGFDVLNADYFDIDDLPPLSEDRILKSQIEMLYTKISNKDFETYFD